MTPKDEWITVESASTELLAEIWRGRLEAEGIEAILRGNKASSTIGAVNQFNTSWSNPLGGVEVRVHCDNEARAREILKEGDDEEAPHRATPRWIQWCVALWIAFAIFIYVTGFSGNNVVGFLASIVAFGALLVMGKRRLK